MALYLLLLIATRLPFCQTYVGEKVAAALARQLGTDVSIGRVNMGLFNRIIIDDILIRDQQQKEMLRISRMTARVEVMPLREGKYYISSAQLFSAHAQFYQKNKHSQPNFQFVIDSLAPKDTTSQTPLDVRVNSLIMRRSSITYDRLDTIQTPGLFNTSHLCFSDINAHVVLKRLTDDAIDLTVKKFGLQEQSGLTVGNISLRLKADKSHAVLSDLVLDMPSSHLSIDSISASYQFEGDNFKASSLTYSGVVSNTTITPSDLRCFYNPIKNLQRGVRLATVFHGTWRHLDVPQLELSTEANDIRLMANGFIDGLQKQAPAWALHVSQLALSDNAIDFLQKNISQIPPQLRNIGSIMLRGDFSGKRDGLLAARGLLQTGIGRIDADFTLSALRNLKGCIKTEDLNLQKLTGDTKLGILSTNLTIDGNLPKGGKPDIKLDGTIARADYNNYSFSNITLNGTYQEDDIAGSLSIDDPNIKGDIEGEVVGSTSDKLKKVNISGVLVHLAPQAIGLSSMWGDATFSGNIEADFTAQTLNDAIGSLRISHFTMEEKAKPPYHLDNLSITSGFDNGIHYVTFISDFAKIDLQGIFEYATLPQSITNMLGAKLPTLPGLPPISEKARNNFALRTQVYKTDWLQRLLGVDLNITQPATFDARINDLNRTLMLDGHFPAFTYKGAVYNNAQIHLLCPTDTLRCDVSVNKIGENGHHLALGLKANAYDNKLTTSIDWNDGRDKHRMSGEFNSITQLYRNLAQKPEAHVRIQPSHIILNDTVWNVEPSDILYSENDLLVDHFNVHHHGQHITIDGRASKDDKDSLTIDLNEVEVAYILDLVDFHTVEFSGKATGTVKASSLFRKFGAHANLKVTDFKFEDGRMGTLFAHADWNKEKEQIDISAVADDGPEAITRINGYVSPVHNTISLAFGARGTYIDFMHSFTKTFLSSITGHAEGDLLLAGTLDDINLTGRLLVDGKAKVTALNTEYEMQRDTVIFIPDEIVLRALPLNDRFGNRATLSGGIHHQHLTNLTFDLSVDADNLLAYDFKGFGESNFYGTVFASGDVAIKGRPGEVTIDCNVTPQKNSVFIYNASSPVAISKQEFIEWGSASVKSTQSQTVDTTPDDDDIPTDIYINFLVNCTPDATMRLLMDANTNDYITLNGEGAIRATYYNKGPFNMFGTYTVDRGTYGVTIQNIIQKNFVFSRGGTIVFGGDPYNAALNLQARHTVNGVSLSDLNIGNTFASNTIRVNCLMNIGGQPNAPQVDFDLEMPTVNADEQQMVRSYINGQQEMNQQVLYLLAIGRFYNQGQNNANAQQQDQTSLAMQSFLSGTISTQINNLLNTVIKNDNWNFGANISTGNEGWHNAEYEGLISGRMLNNRLLLNGQFGYRDNAKQATPSFIGDFDIQYLLFPNGNLSLKMYNQTNDRYFTKSSLNTQGIGIIMKKDFNGLGDLFSTRKKKKAKATK